MKVLFVLVAMLSLVVTSASVAVDKQIDDEVGVNGVVMDSRTPGTAMIWMRSQHYLLLTRIL